MPLKKIKIVGISSIRSDYDLLSPLYRLLSNDAAFDFRLLVGGTHLSSSFGYTFSEIAADGFNVLAKVESLLDADSKSGRIKSANIFSLGATDALSQFAPDVIIYAGDREDALMASTLGAYLGIPTVHFYGGDHTQDGYVDNPVRHAISKLSTWHFVSCEQHARRLNAIGESQDRIRVIGSIALDNLRGYTPPKREQIYRDLNIQPQKRHALVIYHPIEEHGIACENVFHEILSTLADSGVFAFVSAPNSDPMGRRLLSVRDAFKQNERFHFYNNLNRDHFRAIYATAEALIGNSSSGILESASLGVPVLNIGERQRGRMAPKNVRFIDASKTSIREGIPSVLASGIKESFQHVENPYGDGESAEKALRLLKSLDLKSLLLKREDPLS